MAQDRALRRHRLHGQADRRGAGRPRRAPAARRAQRRAKLEALAADLGGELETAVADVARPESVRALVEPGDVIVATVGPFARHGDPAVEAAIAAGALYLDSTGEPAFIRRVFERYGADAARAGASLVTAFGYDWVPGNLAGALALRDAGDEATRVDIGYFTTGGGLGGMSGGTRASAAGAMLEPAFVWRSGIRTERGAVRMRSFEVAGKSRQAISVGSSEHFALPALYPGLREVNVYLGWFGSSSRAMQAMAAVNAGLAADPGPEVRVRPPHRPVRPHLDRRPRRRRARADRIGDRGDRLRRREIASSPGSRCAGSTATRSPAEVLAWGAASALEQGMEGVGALGPASAFGLDRLEAGCAEAGISRVA